DVVDDLGEILFHGAAIRPGKPAGAGVVNGKMVFTLSGQPVAAMSQFDMFARKYLFEMHLELDRNLSLADSHKYTKQVEISIQKYFPNSEIVIHQDPI
ncbi:MAG: hypothetical protein IKA03_05830, partial [Alphaproteobacteria bacterium]|nr:hypothetical protein [Alphaproteobacteria bacterium]